MKELIKEYLQLKTAEEEVKRLRVEAGRKIAEKLDHPEEGQKTHKVDDYKVTVKGVINYKVDWDRFDLAMRGSDNPAPTVIKRSLDVKGLKWYQENDNDRYRHLLEAITTTPGNPQITIKGAE